MNLSRIKCPYCGEEIAATAKKCRFCNEWLPASGTTGQTQQPVTPQATPQQQAYQQTAYQQTGYVQSQQQPIYQQPAYQQSAYQQAPMQQPIYQAPATTDVVDDEEEEDDDDDYTPSFFEAYFKWSFFSEYKDFGDVTGRKSFWLSMLSLLIINLGITGIALLIVALSNMASWALTAAGVLIAVWSLVMIVPSIAIGCRRLRDAEKSPWLYLLCLIPLVGPIILLVLWCQASKYEDSDYYAEFKPVDIIITAVSIILLVGGIISLGKGVSDLLGGMNGYDTEYYIDNESENEEYAIAETDEDNETGEISSDDYSESRIVPETDSEFGFSNGMNYFDGNMISKQGKKFPFKLQFVCDTSTGEISNAVYRNVNYGTTIKLTGYENSDGDIVLEGKDGRKPFIIQFSGNGTYTGDAWSGDFHQDIELFKQ